MDIIATMMLLLALPALRATTGYALPPQQMSLDSADRVVSRLSVALGAQNFRLIIMDGGGATLTTAGGEHLTSITSFFSEPGPVWHEMGSAPNATDWIVTVDRSRASSGIWTATANATAFHIQRTYVLDDVHMPRRVLVNDTLSTHSIGARQRTSTAKIPLPSDVVGVSIRHTATVATTADEVDFAATPGSYSVSQCGTQDNPGTTCESPCLDRDIKNTNNGRPDVFANRSGFGIGLTPLDDVFRVHCQTHQAAMATAPRMGYTGMKCPVTDPPTISIADPSFAMLDGGDEYTVCVGNTYTYRSTYVT